MNNRFLRLIALLAATMAVVHYLLSNNNHYSGAQRQSVSSSSFTTSLKNNVTSRLFPPALDMIRRGLPLTNAYTCYKDNNNMSFSPIEAAKKHKQSSHAGLRNVNIEMKLELHKSLAYNTTACSCNSNTENNNNINTTLQSSSHDSQLCCQRRIFAGHKMGTFLQMSIIDDYNNKMKSSQQHHHHHISIHKGDFDEFPNGNDIPYTNDHLLHPIIDYRDVIILRNIYDR